MAKRGKPIDGEGATKVAPNSRSGSRGKVGSQLQLSDSVYNWNCRDSGEPLIYDYIDAVESWANYLDDGCIGKEYEQDLAIEKSREIIDAFRRYLDHEVSTLDEAFGVSRPAGYRRPAAEREAKKKGLVQTDVLRFVQAGAVIDEALFSAVGSLHGVGKTTVSEWWAERPFKTPRHRLYRVPLPPELEALRGEVAWVDSSSALPQEARNYRRVRKK